MRKNMNVRVVTNVFWLLATNSWAITVRSNTIPSMAIAGLSTPRETSVMVQRLFRVLYGQLIDGINPGL